MKNYTLLLCTCLVFASIQGQVFSDHIHVDQFGYHSGAPKVAVLSDPQIGFNAADSYTPSSTLHLVNAISDQVVFSGSVMLWNNGAVHTVSGDRCWWFDFSEIESPGIFYVRDEENDMNSAAFKISADPYAEVIKQAGRMFYYNRCNATKSLPYAEAPWTDGDNFTQDQEARYINAPADMSLIRDVSGGWFDAGDYNKYVTFAHNAVHDMLSAYESHPEAFTDDWDIPESGNGIPDILDEVIWELQWLERMLNEDGSAHIKAGSQNYSENTSSPPSANNDQRFYGPTCSAASASIASMFAHAALVLASIEGQEDYADILTTNAASCFNYCLPFFIANTLETTCDDGSIVAGDADMDSQLQKDILLSAGMYLFELTSNASYNQFLTANYTAHSIFQNAYFNHYSLNSLDALLAYYNAPGSSPLINNAFLDLVNSGIANNYESLFFFNDLDPYRAFMPEYSFHWGSNSPMAALGCLNDAIAQSGLVPNPQAFEEKAAEQVHYFHGVNPLNVVYLSNMYSYGAEKSINEIYHTWFYDGTDFDHATMSLYGPAPGFLVGGPNAYFSYSALNPPYGQPSMKSYLDFNTGFPQGSWEVSEPAIYYQARYLRLLASQVTNAPTNPNSISAFSIKGLRAYPNPVQTLLNIDFPGDFPNDTYKAEVWSLMGQKLLSEVGNQRLNLQGMLPGMYVLMVTNIVSGDQWTKMIAKE